MDTQSAPGLIDLLTCLSSATDTELELGTSHPRHLFCKFISEHESKSSVPDLIDLDVCHIQSIIKLLQRLTAKSSFLLLFLKFLKILSRGSAFRKLAGKECVANLVPCLRAAANLRIAAEGVNVLLNLCFERDNVLALLDHNGAQLLLRFLQEPDQALLFNTVGAIQSVSFHRQGRKQLLRRSCVPPLVHLLDTDQSNILERGVAAIHNLSADADAIKSLRENHALPKLVALLDCPRLRTAASAAGALQNMSREVASRLVVLELHATGPLTNLLSSTEPQAQVCAAGALLNIMGPDLDQADDSDATRHATLRVVSSLLSLSMIYHTLFQERPPLDIQDLEAIQRPPSAISSKSASPERLRASMDGTFVPAGSPQSSSRRWSARSLTRELLDPKPTLYQRPASTPGGSDNGPQGVLSSMVHSGGWVSGRPQSAVDSSIWQRHDGLPDGGSLLTRSVEFQRPLSAMTALPDGHSQSGVVSRMSWPTCDPRRADVPAVPADSLTSPAGACCTADKCVISTAEDYTNDVQEDVQGDVQEDVCIVDKALERAMDDLDISQSDQRYWPSSDQVLALIKSHRSHQGLNTSHPERGSTPDPSTLSDHASSIPVRSHACPAPADFTADSGSIALHNSTNGNMRPVSSTPDFIERFQRRLDSWGSDATSWDMVGEEGSDDVWAQPSARSRGSGRLEPWCSSSKNVVDKPPMPASPKHHPLRRSWSGSPRTGLQLGHRHSAKDGTLTRPSTPPGTVSQVSQLLDTRPHSSSHDVCHNVHRHQSTSRGTSNRSLLSSPSSLSARQLHSSVSARQCDMLPAADMKGLAAVAGGVQVGDRLGQLCTSPGSPLTDSHPRGDGYNSPSGCWQSGVERLKSSSYQSVSSNISKSAGDVSLSRTTGSTSSPNSLERLDRSKSSSRGVLSGNIDNTSLSLKAVSQSSPGSRTMFDAAARSRTSAALKDH